MVGSLTGILLTLQRGTLDGSLRASCRKNLRGLTGAPSLKLIILLSSAVFRGRVPVGESSGFGRKLFAKETGKSVCCRVWLNRCIRLKRLTSVTALSPLRATCRCRIWLELGPLRFIKVGTGGGGMIMPRLKLGLYIL